MFPYTPSNILSSSNGICLKFVYITSNSICIKYVYICILLFSSISIYIKSVYLSSICHISWTMGVYITIPYTPGNYILSSAISIYVKYQDCWASIMLLNLCIPRSNNSIIIESNYSLIIVAARGIQTRTSPSIIEPSNFIVIGTASIFMLSQG